MDVKDYQKIYQNIFEKSPIESGVQTLVYMFLYNILKNTDYQLIVIDQMRKKTQFVTPVGIPDLAIVSDDFRFSEKSKNGILSYVEVKDMEINLSNYGEQIEGQLLSCGKVLCTNGNEWKYYDIEKYIEQNIENDADNIRAKNDYDNVKKLCGEIEQAEMEVATQKASYTRDINDENKIQELNQKINEDGEKLKNSLRDIQWLQDVMKKPIIDKKIFENGKVNVVEYMKLKSELYSIISEWCI